MLEEGLDVAFTPRRDVGEGPERISKHIHLVAVAQNIAQEVENLREVVQNFLNFDVGQFSDDVSN